MYGFTMVYMYIYISIYIYMYICVYMCIYMYIYYIYMHIYTYIYTHTYICISYNTGKSALPDIHTWCPRAHSARGRTAPEGECIYIRQSTSACVITNMLHFWHSQNLPKPEGHCSAFLYTVGCGFWLWVLVMMFVWWFCLENHHTNIITKTHNQISQATL